MVNEDLLKYSEIVERVSFNEASRDERVEARKLYFKIANSLNLLAALEANGISKLAIYHIAQKMIGDD